MTGKFYEIECRTLRYRSLSGPAKEGLYTIKTRALVKRCKKGSNEYIILALEKNVRYDTGPSANISKGFVLNAVAKRDFKKVKEVKPTEFPLYMVWEHGKLFDALLSGDISTDIPNDTFFSGLEDPEWWTSNT